jgi:hypothetical protein
MVDETVGAGVFEEWLEETAASIRAKFAWPTAPLTAANDLNPPRYHVWRYENGEGYTEPNNFHEIGKFHRAADAIAAAQWWVDEFTTEQCRKNPADALRVFTCFGDVPVINAIGDAPILDWDAYDYLKLKLGLVEP